MKNSNFAEFVNEEVQKKKHSAAQSEFSLQYKGDKNETPTSNRSSAYPQSQFGQLAQQSKDISPTCQPIKIPLNSQSEFDFAVKNQRSEKEIQQQNSIPNKSDVNQKSDKNMSIYQQQTVKSEKILTQQSITISDRIIPQSEQNVENKSEKLIKQNLVSVENENREEQKEILSGQETTPIRAAEHEDNLQDQLEELNRMLEMKKLQKKKTLVMQTTSEIEVIQEEKENDLQTGTAVDKRKNNQNIIESESHVFNFNKEPDFNLTSPEMKSANVPPIFSMDPNQQKQNIHLSFNQLNSQNSAENINSKRNLNDQKDKSISQIAHNQSEDFSQLGIENELLNQQPSTYQMQDPDENLSNLNDFSSPNPLQATPVESTSNSTKKPAVQLKNVVQSKIITQLRSAGGLNSKNTSSTSSVQKDPKQAGSSTQITKTTTVTTSANSQPKATSSYLVKKQIATTLQNSKSKTEPSNLNSSIAKGSTTKLKSQQSLNVGSATNLNKSLVGNRSTLSVNPNNVSSSEIKQNSYSQIKANSASSKGGITSTVTRTPLKGSTMISKTSTTTSSGPSTSTKTIVKTEGAKSGTGSVVKTTTTTTKTSSYSQQAASKKVN